MYNAGRSSREKGVCPSVRLSVCLSVKRVNCDKTEEKKNPSQLGSFRCMSE